ncbi:MAG: methionyl-tRNA formyltransferase [Clostridia bacterium]|nr:methionyl-tRNA formyltransferase [Clostridia bacterium]
MRIVFMGTPDFAVPSLQALIDSDHEVVGVFTQPDRPKGRGNKLTPSPVKVLAQAHNIPVYQPLKIRKDGLEDLIALKPDLCVTAAFGQILSQSILDVPVKGTVNVHASLLPKHRGSSPIVWGLVMGDTTFGITTMLTDKGIDTGMMLLKRELTAEPLETAGELTQRLAKLGAELLTETLEKFDTLTPIPQDESEATYEPMLKKEMGLMDFTKSAHELACLVKGLNPWPGCYTPFEEGMLKVWLAREAEGKQGAAPGEIILADPKKGLFIQTGEGALEILTLQAPGKKQMNAKDFLRGHPLKEGELIHG